jgi:hypothetical protein
MYRRALSTGKAIIQGVPPHEVKPMLAALDSERVWLMTGVASREEADALLRSLGR